MHSTIHAVCGQQKGQKTELKAMCDFKKKKKKKKKFFFFFLVSRYLVGSRYDTRIAGPSIAMHRCIDASLRPYNRPKPAVFVRTALGLSSNQNEVAINSKSGLWRTALLTVPSLETVFCVRHAKEILLAFAAFTKL